MIRSSVSKKTRFRILVKSYMRVNLDITNMNDFVGQGVMVAHVVWARGVHDKAILKSIGIL